MLAKSEIKDFIQIAKPGLAKMDLLVDEILRERDQLLVEVTRHIISSGGKRIRPSLTIVSSALCGFNEGTRDISLAASVEFLHTATLLHDDVVDDSKLRRGKETAGSKFGNQASILVGDFLLSQAFCLMVSDGSLEVLRVLSEASAVISEGEVMQLSKINNLSISREEYLKIIKAKTAELFAASCEIGAILTESSFEKQQALRNFGMNLGIAFQIIDDLLDYESSALDLGKNIGDDFSEGKLTLPVIIAIEKTTNSEEKKFWVRTMQKMEQNENDLETAISLIKKHSALQEAREIAEDFARQALEELHIFDDSPAKSALEGLMNFAINRKY